MAIENIIDGLNLPKQILDKSTAFLNRLLGPSVDEAAQLVADKIRFRRFRNQVRVLQRAEQILDAARIAPSGIGLRTLVPLVEKASLEENDSIQEMWAKLLANAAAAPAKAGLHSVCIHILGGISPHEAVMMSRIHSDYVHRRPELLAKTREWKKEAKEVPASYFTYRPATLIRETALDRELGDLLIDNLIRLGVLRYEVPPVEDGETTFPAHVELTDLGLAVLKEVHQTP